MTGRRSRPGRALRALAVAAVCAAGAIAAVALLRAPADVSRGASTAPASPATGGRGLMESMFQDDRELIYSPTATVVHTLNVLRSLGVDRLRLTVLWDAIAPAPTATVRPAGFAAADPAAYPAAAWAPYDRVLRLAYARGIGVDFDVTAPGPLWAMRRLPPGAPAKEANHYAPSAIEFAQFVTAVGRRYGGRYVPPGSRRPLPRVGYWSVWNEPNQPGWLAPQTATAPGAPAITAARLYRGYVDAAVGALDRTGHRADTILVGELAPEGDERPGAARPVPPLPFLRALYCVDARYVPLTGGAARALGCPSGGSRAAFVDANPALFDATGFAHHPYSFFLPPAATMTDVNFAPLSDLGRLEQALDRVFTAYAVHRQIPIYLTEYGYETLPPNPYRGVAPATQAAYLDEAAYLAWRDPRVRALSQFLLVDSPPDTAYRRGSVGYWSTFQTGLEYADGQAKPSLRSYRLPIDVPAPAPAPGAPVTVWGMLRAAPNDTTQRARVQWRPEHGAFRTLVTVQTSDPSGAVVAQVRPPGSGELRLAWTAPGGTVVTSRAVRVTG